MTANKISLPLAAALLAGSAMIVIPRAEATVTLAATFDEKVDNAQAIVLGKVVRNETRWDEEKKFILTYTTFQVEKSLKGGAPQTVTLVTPGGRVGEVQQTTVGVPVFEEGDENVVFLRNTRRGPTVLYFDQGAYEVVSERGDRVVRPVATDAVRIDEQRGMAVAPEHPRTLREFETAIRSAERRVRHQRMKILEEKQRKEAASTSIWTTLGSFKWLIAAAALGLALATIHFARRG